MAKLKFMVDGQKVYLDPWQIESILYNALTFVAKMATTDDGLSLFERAQRAAEDMAELIEEFGLGEVVERVKRCLGLVEDDA